LQHGGGRLHHRRRHRQVINPVGADVPLGLDFAQSTAEHQPGGGIADILGEVAEGGGKGVPLRFLADPAPGKPLHPFPEPLAKDIVLHGPAGNADNGKPLGQLPVQPQVIEGGDEFAPGQIAGGTENHHYGRSKLCALRHG